MRDHRNSHHLLWQIKQSHFQKKVGREEEVSVRKGLRTEQKYRYTFLYKKDAYVCIYVWYLAVAYFIILLKALGRSVLVTEQIQRAQSGGGKLIGKGNKRSGVKREHLTFWVGVLKRAAWDKRTNATRLLHFLLMWSKMCNEAMWEITTNTLQGHLGERENPWITCQVDKEALI